MPKNPDQPGRVEQMRAVYRLAAERDRLVLLKVGGPALAVLAVLVVVGLLIGQVVYFSLLAVLAAVGVGATLFGRRANSAIFAQVEGQPGAAAAIAQSLRGDWRVTPAVAVTRSFDIVHRVVGRPGVVLIGEGGPARVTQLIQQEKKRVGRVVGDAPIYDVMVGEGEGQVPLRRLQRHLLKLPRNLRPKQVDALETRMRALGTAGAPLPKGPLPRGVRMPRGRIR
jgi:xanthosine utilization system XapX-like protein